MSIITKMRVHEAYYWKKSGLTRTGSSIFNDAIKISCRWEDTQEEIVDNNGNKITSKSLVYVGNKLNIGDFLLLNTDSNINVQADPQLLADAYEIVKFTRYPNLKGTEYLNIAYL